MCTLIVLHRCFPDAELLVAANRDEYLERPAEGPELRSWQGRTVLAPRDTRAGGTWLGMNDTGVFAALTNRPNPTPDPSRRSRGLLVADALAAGSAAEASARLAELPARTYNPFNLVVCDREDAFVIVYEEKPAARRLAAGAHVIGNGDPNSSRHPKVARLQGEVRPLVAGSSDQALEALGAVCRSHRGGANPLEDTCIHTDRYGTRSSTLLRWGSRPEAHAFHFADGAPCERPYQDFTPLLAQLERTGARAGAATRDHA
ncbi:MAG: NRDE family protein [Myxococcota bacterium]